MRVSAVPKVLIPALGLLALGFAGVGAQEVRGTVRMAETGEPVSAAVVRLVDEAGATAGLVLSDEAGSFRVAARAPGRYGLAIERIGLATVRVEPFDVAAGQVVVRHVTVGYQPVSLAGISVRGERRCRLQGEASDAVQRLWDEARKTLTAVSLLENAWYVSFRVALWQRDLDPENGRVLSEQVRRETVIRADPFPTAPAEELVRDGFIRREAGDTATYFGPDARVLLSDAFLGAYCFRAVAEGRDSIGLAFEPLREDRSVTGIEGVLWMDRETAALRRLDFEYTDVPSPSRRVRSGGSIRFARLENGAWITSFWRLRMPRFAVVNGRLTGRIALMSEAGGEVLDATVGLGESPFTRTDGGLAGRLLGDDGAPIPGALVYLSGTARGDTTDGSGAFRIPELPPGSYALAWLAPDDPVAERVRVVELEMPEGDTSIVARAAGESYLRGACGAGPGSHAVIAGIVRGPDGIPAAGAPVRLSDVDGRIDLYSTDAAGRFHFCDAIPGTLVEVATRDGNAEQYYADPGSGTRRVTLQTGTPDAARVVMGPEAAAGGEAAPPDRAAAVAAPAHSAAIIGRLLDADTDGPITGAAVVLLAGSTGDRPVATAVTDEAGGFALSSTPPGRYRLRTHRIGYREVTSPPFQVEPGRMLQVELRAGVSAVPVEPLRVVAAGTSRFSSRRLTEVGFFDRRERWGREGLGFGHFLDQDDLDRRTAHRVSDLLRDLPGVFVEGAGGTDQVILMRATTNIRQRRCEPGFYIDGRPFRLGGSIDDILSPASITALEVYPGLSRPGQFTDRLGPPCGAIVIWTGGRQ